MRRIAGAAWRATGILLVIGLRVAECQFTSIGSDLTFLVQFPRVTEDKDHPFVDCIEDPERPCRNNPSEKCGVFLPNQGMCRYLSCLISSCSYEHTIAASPALQPLRDRHPLTAE
jgi:hypothetical protein